VAAWASVAPSGIGTTEAAGTTTSAACAPPSGRLVGPGLADLDVPEVSTSTPPGWVI
jgi:hypothetical protein